jgi:hypothetical protein
MTDFLVCWADYWEQLNNQSSETSKLQGILAQNDDYQQLPDMTIVEDDINQIVKFWQGKNIKPGSNSALRIAY